MAQEEHLLSQGCFISNDPETIGFDLSSGSKWIYPDNYPRRDYQFTIVQTALYNNTLVCLPTGLGKTFIAAVVMYNFWRWYPRGRVIFMAPTKPLVAQQIEACHQIMGIPSEQTIELTGATNQNKRRQAWIDKRVVFATPQTFQKDLQNDCVPSELIKCIVIDEAHKALGKHSYCEIVRMLCEKSKFFRVLALSATPGSKVDHVKEVIQNLLISKLELRDDTSPDIIPYTNNRSLEKVIVNLDEKLLEYKDKYTNIMDPHVRILVKCKLIQGSTANISKGRIFMLMKQYESRPNKASNHGTIMKTLNILLTMYHAYELLIKHGLRAFYNFYSSHSDKFWLEAELDLQLLLADIKRYIGEFPVIHPLPDGSIPDIPNDLIFGHNKFNKLREILVEHFKSFSEKNETTRAIVFVEYRDIVNEVYLLLLQIRPLIRPQMFVGQAGQKQRQQIEALENFRSNKVNVLISTSVGEEGLDVGEVDLIVCFDISTSTPTRLVQRMGRTGRKRSGRVVLLLTEGKEVQTLYQALCKKDSLNNNVLQSENITSALYQSSPRMIPESITPQYFPIYIKTQPKTPKIKIKKIKALVGKKPRKKVTLEDDGVVKPSTSKTVSKISSSAQSSMMKFLTDQRPKKKESSIYNNDSDSGILSEEFQKVDKTNDRDAMIKPGDVKLLTSDSQSLEFLTLCAMKKSQQETFDSNIIKIDMTWIPRHSPVNIFQDFTVPSLDTLDCIKNLTLYEKSIEDEEISNSPESMIYIPSDNDENDAIRNRESNYFENFSPVESKYVNKSEKEDLIQEYINTMEINYFNDYTSTESKYVKDLKKSNFNDQNIEINADDFCDNDFFTVENKNDPMETLKISHKKNFIESIESKNINDGASSRIPAHVEVDFEDILDEYTESEAESQVQIDEQQEEKNIFDDLLEESSSEDLFDFSDDEQNNTVIENKQNNETVFEKPIQSIKRSASRSPCRDSTSKKQKVSETNSDDEYIIPSSQFQSGESRSFLSSSNQITKSESVSRYPDSDEDLFDDIEFETQLTFKIPSTQNTNKTCIDQNNVNKESLPLKKNKGFLDKSNNETILNEQFDEEIEEVFNEEIAKVSSKESVEKEKKQSINLEIESFVKSKKRENHESQKDLKKGKINEHLSDAHKNADELSKNIDEINLNDLDLDNWDDDDFASDAINKNKTEKESFSSFFQTNSKTKFSEKSRSQEPSSSGWISTIGVQPRKTLTFKNLNAESLSNKKSESIMKLNFDNLKTAFCKNPNISDKKNDDRKVFNVHELSHPKLRLSLKKNLNPSINRDKDGFAFPQGTVKINSDKNTNEFAIPKVPNTKSSEKENISSRWIENKKIKNSISPRFRKYHSVNNLCSNKKKKIRKRIASDFIDDEAEVSSDTDTSEESSDDEDEDLGNFVSYTQEVSEDVDMTAHYLQTMNKSPIKAGAFMFKKVKNPIPDYEIYSQPMSQVDDSYLHDSFCVKDDVLTNDETDFPNDDCILEDLEFHLENRSKAIKRKKKSKFKRLENRKINKNKKNSSNNDTSSNSSSEDEIETLRRQILDESQLLKESKH